LKFGPVPLAEAEGAILAHAVRYGKRILKKGLVLRADELAALAEAGVASVTAARLEAGDVEENEAARRVAASLMGAELTCAEPATGRVNLFAANAGILRLDARAIDRLNRVSDDVTLATLPDLAPVAAGQMVATVKIIPFSVTEAALARAVASGASLAVHAYRPLGARLIQTVNEGLKPSVIEKTSRVTGERMARLGGGILGETHCAHDTAPLAAAIGAALAAGCDLLLVIGASAIVDRRDVIPAAIEVAGGRVERLGMPVDPGNLILVGSVGAVPVLGLPGCARSPSRNGLDWVLERLAAGIPVTAGDIAGMGVGGLLIGGEEEKDYL
jgi:molybdenum cofactor cytidylyltransferase